MKILHIISSPRKQRSKSQMMWEYILSKLDGEKETLNLYELNMPFLSEWVIWHNYWFVKYVELNDDDKKIVDLQTKFINQLKNCDTIVVSAPIWNFSIPAILKAYFELVIKVWDTFTKWDKWYEWLVKNIKNCYTITTAWWFYKWMKWENESKIENDIIQKLNFIWIKNISYFVLEWTNSIKEEELNIKIEELKKEIDKNI